VAEVAEADCGPQLEWVQGSSVLRPGPLPVCLCMHACMHACVQVDVWGATMWV
jgi:hypothetical protein